VKRGKQNSKEEKEGHYMKEKKQIQPIDMEEALEIMDGDEELLKEIFDDFINDYPEIIAKIKETIEVGDAENLNSFAHQLKGMLKNVAATRVADIAFELETMGKEQDLSKVADIFDRLEEACQVVKNFMDEYEPRREVI
jgi:two-component system sensor histidine kinase/response regulator